jgi:23S rRNA G2069 N7-methylase RlmK/C1962 C5-methylase RlmI
MILYRDDDWVVVDKPEGMVTHAASPGELGVVEWLELHLDMPCHVVSRLDRGTSGALLLARNAEASARAQEIHEGEEAAKIYEFISHVDSRKLGYEETWVCEESIDGKPATTRFTRMAALGEEEGVQRSAPLYRYQARIARGRKHQIRRHAAHGRLPILGDDEYGGRPFPRLCLHCMAIRWPELEAPVQSRRPCSFQCLERGDSSTSRLGLALCRDRRGNWLESITDSFRLVHRDEIQNMPASVDIYGEWFNAVWYDEMADSKKAAARLDPLLRQIMKTYDLRGGVVRNHRRNPHKQRLVAQTRTVGEEPPETFTVTEHGLRYEINLLATQHTGLFLDQRDNRRRVMLAAQGRRLANLFAFTCSFSVAAARAGCEVVFSVDTAKACLNTGKTNFELNELNETGQGKFIQEDVRKWLDRQLRRLEEDPAAYPRLDLVVCDPPVFSSSKDGGKFSVEREWPQLAYKVAKLMGKDSVAIFANNHRGGKHAVYRGALEENFGDVVDLRPPLDFPVAGGRPHHVRMFWCRQKGGQSRNLS